MHHQKATVAVWLLLLAEGGWWTTREINDHFTQAGLGFVRGAVAVAVHNLQRSGFLARREGDNRKATEFALTANCMVPTGVTVQLLQETLFSTTQFAKE